MAHQYSDKIDYQQLAEVEEGQPSHEPIPNSFMLRSKSLRILSIGFAILLSTVAGFSAGASWTRYSINATNPDYSATTAPRIPIPYTKDTFIYSSPFSLPPPTGAGSSEKSEPIWDALVPSKFFVKHGDFFVGKSLTDQSSSRNIRWLGIF